MAPRSFLCRERWGLGRRGNAPHPSVRFKRHAKPAVCSVAPPHPHIGTPHTHTHTSFAPCSPCRCALCCSWLRRGTAAAAAAAATTLRSAPCRIVGYHRRRLLSVRAIGPARGLRAHHRGVRGRSGRRGGQGVVPVVQRLWRASDAVDVRDGHVRHTSGDIDDKR